jgi:hypothetical protein
LDRNALTCEEAARLFDRLVEGDVGLAEEKVLRVHLAACGGCRSKFALDLALMDSIRTAPEGAFESVAVAVVGDLRSRARRRWALGWGTVVATICALWFATGHFGLGIRDAALSLITGSFKTSPAYIALSKVAGLLVDCANALRGMALGGTLPRDLGAYAPQAALVAIAAGVLVILLMYAMGRWLGKPMEVNSWRRG